MKALDMLKELESSKVCKFFCKSRVDEAIEEIKNLQNRSCSNCKYIKKYNKTEWECKKSVKTNYFSNYIEHSFCYNKWELR